ncbi:MAG: UvrD-helicase domain-containing protein, partial [Candidatus Binatia bacterium]
MNFNRESPTLLSDQRDRDLAATTFDRNLIVTAGAGTGKTTLLVDRLVNLLMREPDPVQIDEIIALTFTNKAANEMKIRLRERLQSLLETRLDLGTADEKTDRRGEILSLLQRYRLTKDQTDLRAREALRKLERSEIGTIHSFAASLLRLYPVEADLDPQFQEDDGTCFDRHFEESWLLWLDRELSRRAGRKEDWKQVLRKVSLDDLRAFARCLCSETVALEPLATLARAQPRSRRVAQWLQELNRKAQALLQKHSHKQRLIENLVQAALEIFQEVLHHGEVREGRLDAELELVAEKQPNQVQGWDTLEVAEARILVQIAKRLGQVDPALTRSVSDLLLPFARDCRQNFVQRGFVSFDGLLVRARDLVRDHLAVREELKERFKAILIDEFQDTDPIQYEILLYLAERVGHAAKDWKRVELAPGKIFVVGDPKQSIYAFRRADIEAYLDVVENIILTQNGRECRLTVNFRSHQGILDVVNGVFQKLILPRAGLQPSYVGIEPPQALAPRGRAELSFRKIVMRQVESEEQLSAGKARKIEAESLAHWLHDEVLGKACIVNHDQEPVQVQPKDVALLF